MGKVADAGKNLVSGAGKYGADAGTFVGKTAAKLMGRNLGLVGLAVVAGLAIVSLVVIGVVAGLAAVAGLAVQGGAYLAREKPTPTAPEETKPAKKGAASAAEQAQQESVGFKPGKGAAKAYEADYKKYLEEKYKGSPPEEVTNRLNASKKTGVMSFNTKEDAAKFVGEIAKKGGAPMIFSEVGPNGKPNGGFIFADGKGNAAACSCRGPQGEAIGKALQDNAGLIKGDDKLREDILNQIQQFNQNPKPELADKQAFEASMQASIAEAKLRQAAQAGPQAAAATTSTLSQPAPSQPAPAQPAPAQSAPAQPAPTQPAPAQSAPAQPAPTQSALAPAADAAAPSPELSMVGLTAAMDSAPEVIIPTPTASATAGVEPTFEERQAIVNSDETNTTPPPLPPQEESNSPTVLSVARDTERHELTERQRGDAITELFDPEKDENTTPPPLPPDDSDNTEESKPTY